MMSIFVQFGNILLFSTIKFLDLSDSGLKQKICDPQQDYVAERQYLVAQRRYCVMGFANLSDSREGGGNICVGFSNNKAW